MGLVDGCSFLIRFADFWGFVDVRCSRSLSRSANRRSRMSEASPRVAVHQDPFLLTRLQQPGLLFRVFLCPAELRGGSPALAGEGRGKLRPDRVESLTTA
jgi:hypothetical protein